MKAVTQVKNAEMGKFLTAAGWSGVKVLDHKTTGPKTQVQIGYQTVDQLFEMGAYLSTVTDADVKADVERRKKEADAAAAAAKAAAGKK